MEESQRSESPGEEDATLTYFEIRITHFALFQSRRGLILGQGRRMRQLPTRDTSDKADCKEREQVREPNAAPKLNASFSFGRIR